MESRFTYKTKLKLDKRLGEGVLLNNGIAASSCPLFAHTEFLGFNIRKKPYAKVVDLVSLEAPFGPGAPDSDLTNSQINRNFENVSISLHV